MPIRPNPEQFQSWPAASGELASLDFGGEGVTCAMRCSTEAVVEGGKPQSAAQADADRPAPASEAPRILVVEDEPVVALDIAQTLKSAGFEIVGPARTAAQALGLLTSKGCDAAVLDINLGKETSEPVALELARRGAPFVALSGYSAAQHPPAFQGAPALNKPLRHALLVAEMRRCTGQGGAEGAG